jgi:hypothetical protein
MGDGAIRTGWAVFRERYADVASARLRRRRTVVAGSVATAVGIALTIVDLVWHWSPLPMPFALPGIASLAASVGSLVTLFCPVVERGTVDWSFTPTGDWRRQERIQRQFAPRPPELDPRDRDHVLAIVGRSRDTQVAALARTMFFPITWILGAAGLLATGLSFTSVGIAAYPVIYGLLQTAAPIAAATSLGRMELARRRAEAMPPAPPEPPRTWPRGTRPTGSKLGLPGD